jgi:TolB-like protein/DNA-binding winged helix-turn-helix (wHTH) protein
MTPPATSSPAPAKYAFGPFVLDLANRRLLREGVPVGITARIFDILVVLVECRGQAVEKEALLARVWGDVAVEEGNLARAVSTLRKVLGDAPDDPRYIVTLPGRGYQFIAAVTAVEPENAASRADATPQARRTWVPLAAAVALVVIVAGTFWVRGQSAPPAPPRVVVLPFQNLGAAADEYVPAGITEEITGRLAMVHSLRVVSRTTASHYERSGKSAREIGADLGADYLLEGAVLWEASPRAPGVERVRITAQLIRVADDTHAWTETFDRSIGDLFAVQAEIAVRVVRELRSTLLGSERAALMERPTENIEAYRCYLQGLFYAKRPDFSEEAMATAIRHLQRAADLDPGFAQAQAALALAHLWF